MGTTLKAEVRRPPSKHESLRAEQWTVIAAWHMMLCDALDGHEWNLKVLHHVGGMPTIEIVVWAPEDDVFRFDAAIESMYSELMIPGYEWSGQGHACQGHDGLRDREFTFNAVNGSDG